MAYNASMEEVIDTMADLIRRDFQDDVSQVYFGDIGIYPPDVFRNNRREHAAVVVLSPVYYRLQKETRTAIAEYRDIGVDILVMRSMVPYFGKFAKDAPAERQLVRTTLRIASYFSHADRFHLDDDLVHSTRVGDIQWDWTQRQKEAIRGAAIEYEATVRVPRLG